MTAECPPQPPPTSAEMMKHGKHVCTVVGPRSFTIEAWVQKVAAASGQPVDWRQFGGYALILHLGDEAKVIATIEVMLPELVDMYMACEHNFTKNPERIDVQYERVTHEP
jgi:hypothetical protein